MRHWIKLWTEIIDDRKLAGLSDRDFRLAVLVFALAGRIDEQGALPCSDDVAWHLRMDPQTVKAGLGELERVNILTRTPSGWLVTNFAKRNSKPPSASAPAVLDRVTRHREAQRNDVTTSLHRDGNEVVTLPEQNRTEQSRAEEEGEGEGEGERGAPAATAYAPQLGAYHDAIGMITGAQQSQEIFEYLDRLSDAGVISWWDGAIKAAVDANARKWSYIRAVLERCLQSGHPPGAGFPGGRGGGRIGDPLYGDLSDPALLQARYGDPLR